ncbi:hypothetical protein GH714_030217 [Hevea brasiliensis]|uniref:Reverse transcriptase Ty1/copia-type domain-containing protein n=1 Tax=Hevea brasiliensis TaxID=3981 RepID=A0A6A6N824_HEVBR|nr:hypothetical protein GH714_030217 [Hevea brasiliensis]
MQLSDECEMKDLSAAKKILGMEISRDKSVGKLFLSQQAYVEIVLKHFNMNNAKPMTIPFAVHFKLFADMSPKVVKWILRYFKVTIDVGISFDRAKISDSVVGYVDLDFAGDLDKRRSLTGRLNYMILHAHDSCALSDMF